MLGLFNALAVGLFGVELVKEKTEKAIPAEYWRNTELMNMDKLNLSPEQVMKNLEWGKYYLPDVPDNFDMQYIAEYENDKRVHGFLYAYNKAARGEYGNKTPVKQSMVMQMGYDGYMKYLKDTLE